MTTNQSNLSPGRYAGSPTGAASVYENDKKSFVLVLSFYVEGYELRWWTTLATEKDGINAKAIDHLKECFPWDGSDPFWFMDNPDKLKGCEVECTIELRPGTKNPEKLFPSIAYVDPPGGIQEMPQGDRQALLAKYGAKFRAIAGGRTMAPTATASRPVAPPARPANAPITTSTEAECWAKYCSLNKNTAESNLPAGWFAILERLFPGADPQTLTTAQWAAVMIDLEDYVPF